MTGPHSITKLLRRWQDGDKRALDRVVDYLYEDLRAVARQRMSRERVGHTLQATALVGEAYERLVDQRSATYRDRAHFLAVAATIMRRILVDHARKKLRRKRGGDRKRIDMTRIDHAAKVAAPEETLALHQALEKLEARSVRAARLVEMRFFANMTYDEAAVVLRVSVGTLKADWAAARALLHQVLSEDDHLAAARAAGGGA